MFNPETMAESSILTARMGTEIQLADVRWCQHIYDVMGCDWNMPAEYSSGSFDECEADTPAYPMGVYGTSTWYQGVSPTPAAQPVPKSHDCQSVNGVGGASYPQKKRGKMIRLYLILFVTRTNHSTHSSFIEASRTGAPLSSHGPNHAPSLERGKACLTCRQRKIKCDGVKPCCGGCAKSARAHGEDPTTIICNYDEPERGEKRKRASGQNKVSQLEAKIAELEQIIAASTTAQQQQNARPPIPSTSAASTFVEASISTYDNGPFTPNSLDALLKASEEYPGQNIGGFEDATPAFFNNSAPTTTTSQPYTLPVPNETPPVTPPDILLELFYPSWPRDLPTPALVTRLIDVFFSKTHAASGMIHQGRFLASMQLPPNNSGFPHVSLIHAMLATAARLVSDTFFDHEDSYWSKEVPGETPCDFHARKAKAAIDAAIGTGSKLFQVMQASTLICYYSYSAARFVEVWLYCGLTTRMATPLGLNHLRASQTRPDGVTSDRPRHLKPTLLPPTTDEEELYERSTTFWFAVTCDKFASASTGWAMSLDDADITSLLPSPGLSYTTDDPASSPLSPQNPNFMLAHPPHLVQSLQLYLKAIILLGRVVAFMQRAPAPIGMSANIPRNLDNPDAVVDLRTTSAFKRLDADAVTFRLSIPREFTSMQQQGNTDSRMSLVFALPHVCTILLHESFCTIADGDVSFQRCLLSARAILNAVYTLWSTSFELGLLAPFIHYVWAVAGRTLVRELGIKQLKQDLTGQDGIKQDVGALITAMQSCKSGLGDATARSLQNLLDNPSQCLPSKDLKHLGLGFGPDGPMCPLSGRQLNPDQIPSSFSTASSSVPAPAPSSNNSNSPFGFNHISPYGSSNSGTSPGATLSGSNTAPSPIDLSAFLGTSGAGSPFGSLPPDLAAYKDAFFGNMPKDVEMGTEGLPDLSGFLPQDGLGQQDLASFLSSNTWPPT
ncbi:hypothetical protein MNV49_006631 [Pseudohyphozyma bogoriensis]|nr:hypothetical protein MNV49_006631 [Pseudohyphozyma bogoriensis]